MYFLQQSNKGWLNYDFVVPKAITRFRPLPWYSTVNFKNNTPIFHKFNYDCSYYNDRGIGPMLTHSWVMKPIQAQHVLIHGLIETMLCPGVACVVFGTVPVPPKDPVIYLTDVDGGSITQPAVGGKWDRVRWGPRVGSSPNYTGTSFTYRVHFEYTGKPLSDIKISTWWREGSEHAGDEDTHTTLTTVVEVLSPPSDSFVFPFAYFPIIGEECASLAGDGEIHDWTLL